MSRTSIATLQKVSTAGVVSLVGVGANWTRREWARDPDTGLILPGVRLEPERTNLFNQSDHLVNASWTKFQATAADLQAAAPNGETEMATVTASASSGYHTVYGTGSMTNGDTVTTSVYVEAGTHSVILLAADVNGNQRAVADLSSGAFEVTSGSPTARALNCGGGVYRLEVTAVVVTTASKNFSVGLATDTSTETLAAAGTETVNVWGMQVEVGGFASSRIATPAGSTTTRTADSALIYTLGNELAQGLVSLGGMVNIPSHTPSGDITLMKIYEAAAPGTDHITLAAEASTGYLKVTSAKSGGSAGSAVVPVNICDGKHHPIRVAAKPGWLCAWVNEVPAPQDFDAGIPLTLDTFSYEVSGGFAAAAIRPEFIAHHWRPTQSQVVL